MQGMGFNGMLQSPLAAVLRTAAEATQLKYGLGRASKYKPACFRLFEECAL